MAAPCLLTRYHKQQTHNAQNIQITSFLSTSSQSRISLVEEKVSWSSTVSSEATKREKVVTEMLSIHMLSSSNSALVAKNLGNYTAATSPLAWAFLCPSPLWSIVPYANLRRRQAFIYLNAEVRMDIKCICQDQDKDEYEYEDDDDDDDRSKSNKTKTVKHLRWRAPQSLPGQRLASFSQTSVTVSPVSLKYILHALLSFNYHFLVISNLFVPKYALPKF